MKKLNTIVQWIVAVLSVCGGEFTPSQDLPAGLRITAPMPDWILQDDQSLAISYFALWSCADNASALEPKLCNTEVYLDGRRIQSAPLSRDNEYSFSASLPVASSMRHGSHTLEVKVTRSSGAVAELAAHSHFEIVADNASSGLKIPSDWDRSKSRNAGRSAGQEPAAKGAPPMVPMPPRGSGTRAAVMLYHSGIGKRMPARWVRKSIDSIFAQTHTDFDLWELNYGATVHSPAPPPLSPPPPASLSPCPPPDSLPCATARSSATPAALPCPPRLPALPPLHHWLVRLPYQGHLTNTSCAYPPLTWGIHAMSLFGPRGMWTGRACGGHGGGAGDWGGGGEGMECRGWH